MIGSIESQVIWNGRQGGTTWFHPRACTIPHDGSPTVLMTCQPISGSDAFGQVHWSLSGDVGRTWSDPEPISSLSRHSLPERIEEGVCDVVPEAHSQTGTVLAIGHNVYYRDNVLTRPSEGRYTVYVVRDNVGNWSERRKLEWDHPETSGIYAAGCAQRITLPDGDVLVPLSYASKERIDRAVTTVRCSFDGQFLAVKETGNELRLPVGRGLLEPSLAHFDGRYYMTIRAEDGHGYISASLDGLAWADPMPWRWKDGDALTMSTTQQRWLVHSEGLFLVYTRKAEENVNVMRWRAPLYVAQVDPTTPYLLRGTEQVVLPMRGDGVADPDNVARMGNFHTVNVSAWESWVTVGEALPAHGWRGDTLLARIHWSVPNRSAPTQTGKRVSANDSRQEILSRNGAIAVLCQYGLDQILTAEDDPALWAAILIRHWPAPESPDIDPASLRFGVARIPSDQAQAASRSGLEEIETWCFEQTGAGRLSTVPCVERPQISFMLALSMGGSVTDPGLSSGRMYLDVSRPSRGQPRVLVHTGVTAPPNVGTGETRYWQISDQGTWEETQEVVYRWIT